MIIDHRREIDFMRFIGSFGVKAESPAEERIRRIFLSLLLAKNRKLD